MAALLFLILAMTQQGEWEMPLGSELAVFGWLIEWYNFMVRQDSRQGLSMLDVILLFSVAGYFYSSGVITLRRVCVNLFRHTSVF